MNKPRRRSKGTAPLTLFDVSKYETNTVRPTSDSPYDWEDEPDLWGDKFGERAAGEVSVEFVSSQSSSTDIIDDEWRSSPDSTDSKGWNGDRERVSTDAGRELSVELSVESPAPSRHSTDSNRCNDCQERIFNDANGKVSVESPAHSVPIHSTDSDGWKDCHQRDSAEANRHLSVELSVESSMGFYYPGSGWVEQYHPAGRPTKYFRYGWFNGKQRFRHLRGGNVKNPLAIARAKKVEKAIALGKSPKQILELIGSFR